MMLSREALPSPMTVYALFLGMAVGVFYVTGDLLFISPGSDAEAHGVGMVALGTALVVITVYFIHLFHEEYRGGSEA